MLPKQLSLMDPEASRNLQGHYNCIARNKIATLRCYFQFDGTPRLCCCCKSLPGMRTVILSEGFPAKLTVQDLQSSHVKKCATSTQTAYLYALRPKLCHTFQNLAKNISQGQGCQKSPGSHRYRLLVASCWLRATG